jgi:glutamate-ammonia-ligase adenylyltransferase
MDGWRTDYQAQLQHALLRIEPDDVEAQIQALRQFKLAQMLRIAAADILDVLPIAHVSDKLTLLAETILARVVNDAWHHVTTRYGKLPNTTEQDTGLVIIGYGKLGGIELSYRSDLDLVCLFDRPKDAVTDGKKSLSAVEFYTKFVQRIMHLMHTKTLLGDLYECDLRLRPSGNSGLLVSSFETFLSYQQTEAWVWEHQALLRARPVYGEMHSCAKFAEIRNQILSRPRDAKKLAKEVLNMRLKMREHLKAKDKGVMADIEFLTQYWCLANAHQHPNIINYSDNIRQLEALCEANIISETTAQELTQSYLTWRHHQHHMSIQRSQVHDDTTLGLLQDAVHKIWRRVFE